MMKASRFQLTSCLLSLGLLSAGFSSCAHLNEDSRIDPFDQNAFKDPSPSNQLRAEKLPVEKGSSEEKPGEHGSAKSIEGIPLPINSEEGPVVANHVEVRQVKHSSTHQNPSRHKIAPTSSQTESEPVSHPESHSVSQPDTAIRPAGGVQSWCPPPTSAPICPFPPPQYPPAASMQGMGICYPPMVPSWVGGAAKSPSPEDYPDEYLCDGGDRELPVRYDFQMRLGLDTEDAVAEYTDDEGNVHVKPTNRVCVYSPRFGAMRSISSPVAGTSVDQLASADKFLRGAGMRNRDATGTHKQHLAPGKYRTRERASNIETEMRSSAVDQSQNLAGHTKLQNTFEDFQFVQSGMLTQTDEVRLAKGIQAAATWSRNQFPVIAAQTEQSQEVVGEFRAQEIVGREDKSKPGRLRIVKLADKEVAQPGEIITFTIRYDNLGDRELSQVRILDNLTPRLQYVEDSETSDRAGNLLLQDNEEGSVILEFVLDEPLAGGEGGVVTFEAKVQ